MKKLSECKEGDKITVLSAMGVRTETIYIVSEDYLYLDERPFHEQCKNIESWYDTIGTTIYLPAENYKEILKFYNTAVEHGSESLRRKFKILFEIK